MAPAPASEILTAAVSQAAVGVVHGFGYDWMMYQHINILLVPEVKV